MVEHQVEVEPVRGSSSQGSMSSLDSKQYPASPSAALLRQRGRAAPVKAISGRTSRSSIPGSSLHEQSQRQGDEERGAGSRGDEGVGAGDTGCDVLEHG